MIVDFDTLNHELPLPRQQQRDSQFATLMAQYATPLFSPWPNTDQTVRTYTAITSASLSAHPTSSNRREGRHERE